ADLGELRLGIGGERRRHDAQRNLDELEVEQIAGLRLGERLIGVAGLDQLQGVVDRPWHRLQLVERLVARHGSGVGAGGRRAHAERGGAEQQRDDEALHAGCASRYESAAVRMSPATVDALVPSPSLTARPMAANASSKAR